MAWKFTLVKTLMRTMTHIAEVSEITHSTLKVKRKNILAWNIATRDTYTFLHIKSKFYKLHVKLERVMKAKFKCITGNHHWGCCTVQSTVPACYLRNAMGSKQELQISKFSCIYFSNVYVVKASDKSPYLHSIALTVPFVPKAIKKRDKVYRKKQQ